MESACVGNCTEGSNPSLSAISPRDSVPGSSVPSRHRLGGWQFSTRSSGQRPRPPNGPGGGPGPLQWSAFEPGQAGNGAALRTAFQVRGARVLRRVRWLFLGGVGLGAAGFFVGAQGAFWAVSRGGGEGVFRILLTWPGWRGSIACMNARIWLAAAFAIAAFIWLLFGGGPAGDEGALPSIPAGKDLSFDEVLVLSAQEDDGERPRNTVGDPESSTKHPDLREEPDPVASSSPMDRGFSDRLHQLRGLLSLADPSGAEGRGLIYGAYTEAVTGILYANGLFELALPIDGPIVQTPREKSDRASLSITSRGCVFEIYEEDFPVYWAFVHAESSPSEKRSQASALPFAELKEQCLGRVDEALAVLAP